MKRTILTVLACMAIAAGAAVAVNAIWMLVILHRITF